MKPVYRTDNAEWPFAVIVEDGFYLLTDGRHLLGQGMHSTREHVPDWVTLCVLAAPDETSFDARYADITRTRPTLIADDIALVGALASLDLSPWTD